MTKTLITHRLTLNEKARRVALDDGREFLVAPVVAAVGGVMNGEWAKAEAFAETIAEWDGMPVVINHPMGESGPISAFSEGVVHVGFLTSPSVNGKFKAEAWFDVAALQDAGDEGRQVLTNLEAGEITEVSTGYYRDLEPQKGIYKGRVYFGIQHNIRPDHLAILPNEVGACSVADGCGIPRANAGNVERKTQNGTCPCKALNQNKEPSMPPRIIVINEELSLSEKLSQVYDAWYAFVKTAPPVPAKAEGTLWVREVFEDRVIVSGHPDGLLSYPYTVDAAGAITFGEPTRVEIVYQPVGEMAANADANALTWLRNIWSRLNQTQAQNPQRSEAMDRDITINKILATPGNKFSKTTLQKLGDEELTQVEAGLVTNENAGTPSPQPSPAGEGAQATDPALAALTEAVKALTTKVDAITTNQQVTETAEKAKLVAELVANEACKLPEDVLQAMELPALRKAHAAYNADYSGRGMLRFNGNGGAESVEAPIMAMTPAK